MLDTKKTWASALNEMELSVSKANFKTWFQNTFLIREEGGTAYVGVPNEFVKDWLQNKFHKNIVAALRKPITHLRSVEYIISKKEDDPQQSKKFMTSKAPLYGTRELPLDNLYINKEDNLNPRYTFDSFVVGPFNELAYSAAQAILTKPASYNPYFVYGSTGLGKTHLVQALGNALKEKFQGIKVYYTTSEKFSTELVAAIQNNSINSIKTKYRKYDVLIMEDIQFIGGKDKSQEELFHLFNALYDNHKQIIFTSDKHPNYLNGIEDRLRSRFAAGMVVDVSRPEHESKVAILRTKCTDYDFFLEPEIMDYIASVVQDNVRELEGILNSIMIQTQVKNKTLTLAEVKHLIKHNIKPKRSVSIKEIVKTIADFYNLEEENIYEKTRRKEIVRSRQIIMYLLREDFNISYPLIGRQLGGRDHTTVIHSCLKVKKDLKIDPTLGQEIDQLRGMLNT